MENKETRTIWSSNGTEEYYSSMSKSKLLKECKELGIDTKLMKREIGENIKDMSAWEIASFLAYNWAEDQDYEDFVENVSPMLIDQCYDKKVYLSGVYRTWSGGHEAVSVADEKKLRDIMYPDYDSTSWIEQDSKGIYFTESHHDVPFKGGTKMYMYGFLSEEDYRKAEKVLRGMCSEEDKEDFCMEDIEWYLKEEEYVDTLIESKLLKPLSNKFLE